jgi:mRNA interferase RelE/StbE
MIPCTARIKRAAAKALAAIPKAQRLQLVDAIDRLQHNHSRGFALKGEFEGLKCLRVGSNRIVYESRQSELMMLVVRIDHLCQVYC